MKIRLITSISIVVVSALLALLALLPVLVNSNPIEVADGGNNAIHDAASKEYKIPEEIQNVELAKVHGVSENKKLDRWGDSARGVIKSDSDGSRIKARDDEADGIQNTTQATNETMNASANAAVKDTFAPENITMRLRSEHEQRLLALWHREIYAEVTRAMAGLQKRESESFPKQSPIREAGAEEGAEGGP